MATTYGTITAEDGAKVELSKKSEIEEAIINENKKISLWSDRKSKGNKKNTGPLEKGAVYTQGTSVKFGIKNQFELKLKIEQVNSKQREQSNANSKAHSFFTAEL